jgi:Mg2+ and Co2+ transporter CorA
MARALLFDEQAAREVELDEHVATRDDNHLLWIELDRNDEEELRETSRALDIDDEISGELLAETGRARIRDFPSHLHATVMVPEDAAGNLLQIDCLVGDGWLLTLGPREADTIQAFRDRVTGRGELGALDAPSFLAALLEWMIEGYLEAFDAIEAELEEADVEAMRDHGGSTDATLSQLVELRRRTGRLRRALGDHRQVIGALAHPEFDAISTEESSERFVRLGDRLDNAIDLADSAQSGVLGSFELTIARSAQRTNDIMKVLTLASVLLLPTTALAGVMGMNFKVGLFEDTWLFWAVIAVMLSLAAVTLSAARLRHWI